MRVLYVCIYAYVIVWITNEMRPMKQSAPAGPNEWKRNRTWHNAHKLTYAKRTPFMFQLGRTCLMIMVMMILITFESCAYAGMYDLCWCLFYARYHLCESCHLGVCVCLTVDGNSVGAYGWIFSHVTWVAPMYTLLRKITAYNKEKNL